MPRVGSSTRRFTGCSAGWRSARGGCPIDNAYHLLATGRKQPAPQHAATTALHAVQQLVRSRRGQEEQTEQLAAKKGRRGVELGIDM